MWNTEAWENVTIWGPHLAPPTRSLCSEKRSCVWLDVGDCCGPLWGGGSPRGALQAQTRGPRQGQSAPRPAGRTKVPRTSSSLRGAQELQVHALGAPHQGGRPSGLGKAVAALEGRGDYLAFLLPFLPWGELRSLCGADGLAGVVAAGAGRGDG